MSSIFTGANNMARSSATVAASRPRPNSYTAGVTVSLSCNKSADRRTIAIAAGKTVQIGRSSKSGFKGLYASSTNALFDCAVVSRDHAEMSMTSPWQDPRPRITIMDKGSLHGTTVNGRRLDNGTPFELHTGDVIELGERITRGEDAHEGVTLTYKRLDPEPSYLRSPSPAMNRGYQVPDSPDLEASDYESDLDLESLYNYGNEGSSAKTTPEQSKHEIGSQELPINLEGVAGPSIVNLSRDDDEEDDMIIMSAASNEVKESLIIPETYDEDEAPLVLESVPAVTAEVEQSGGYKQNIPGSDAAEDDVESVQVHNTGLCQILIERDGEASNLEGQHLNEHEAEKSEEDDVEYAFESTDDADGQSDSAASDLNNYGSEADSELHEPLEVYSTAHLQHDAPEPHDTEQSQQPLKTSTIHSVLSAEQPKPKAQYDPVRGSQPSANQHATASAYLPNTSMPSASGYTSRWDIQPVAMPLDGPFSGHAYYNAPAYGGAPISFGASFTAPPMFAASQLSKTTENCSSLDRPHSSTYADRLLQAQMSASAGNTSTSNAAQLSTEVSSSKTAGKIAITDIVDDQPDPNAQVVNDASAMIEEAKKMAHAAKSSAVNAESASGKRKADEMETLPIADSLQQPAKKSKQQAADKAIIVKTPAQRIRHHGTVRRVATTAAQYATAAAFGGAATIAFLSSPYAQSLIDFLG
ncbi:hypothetical protein DOTSEDRAFT_70570 [Dothistroma septosporum NZE10]|uniref:FHA domain-containing protein n=1 Tax=Dothistroma septosporum (strain NZE10 / CBS 128990) TaxID=675120 RepID=N1PT14_DOTSN|nr:hypothetical protein DOTSEDRAFT_70570 [Dothistroma septosporum NZE10]